jgi:hypothetical protein
MTRQCRTQWVRAALLAATGFTVGLNPLVPPTSAWSHDNAHVNSLLAAGEFGLAKNAIDQLPVGERDEARQSLALALSRNGLRTAAVAATSQMIPGPVRQETVSRLINQRHSLSGSPVFFHGNSGGTTPAFGNGDRPPTAAPGGAGGGAIADFDSLMDLIETTIAPDTWEALGGPSTMSPYRSGIFVDPQGLVRDIEVETSDRLTNMRARSLPNKFSLADDQRAAAQSNADWTQASSLRVVSLASLRENLLRMLVAGNKLPAEMENLAGLSNVQYVIILDNDVLFAGAVGGVDPAAVPWPTDLQSGRTALGLDLLMAAAKTVDEQSNFGCSIDPTEQGILAAAAVSNRITDRSQAPATASDALAAAMGRQKISLFNVAGDQTLAWLLVDADRHMKQLALGVHEMPNGVLNYLDCIDQFVERNPQAAVPSGQLLRMWFASQAKTVRQSPDSLTFELAGQPIQLLSAKEFADQVGQRQQAGQDPLGQQFAEHFTANFSAIASKYPVYDRLRGAFELTAALQLVREAVGDEDYDALLCELSQPDMVPHTVVSVPKECDSIAVRHTIRTPRQRHEIYMASGGIHITPAASLVSTRVPYPSLESTRDAVGERPIANTRWWWDRN